MVRTTRRTARVVATGRLFIGGTNRYVAYKEAFNKFTRGTPTLMFLERVILFSMT